MVIIEVVFFRIIVTSFRAKYSSPRGLPSFVLISKMVRGDNVYFFCRILLSIPEISSCEIVAKKPNLPALIPKIGISKSLI